MNPACPNLDVVWCVFCLGIELAWIHVDDLQIGQWNNIWKMSTHNVQRQPISFVHSNHEEQFHRNHGFG